SSRQPGAPHPYVMASANTDGNTSYAGVGLEWDWQFAPAQPSQSGEANRSSPLMLTPDSLSAFLQSLTQILCFITPRRTLSICAWAAGATSTAVAAARNTDFMFRLPDPTRFEPRHIPMQQ
ncbi:MAG: hypothetical protein EON48_09985, partial [Acetobacteraceae bacterium]